MTASKWTGFKWLYIPFLEQCHIDRAIEKYISVILPASPAGAQTEMSHCFPSVYCVGEPGVFPAVQCIRPSRQAVEICEQTFWNITTPSQRIGLKNNSASKQA